MILLNWVNTVTLSSIQMTHNKVNIANTTHVGDKQLLGQYCQYLTPQGSKLPQSKLLDQ